MGINNSLHLALTKIIPEQLVPVGAILFEGFANGKMVPDRNPDNCFAQAQDGATLTPTMVLSLKKIPVADALDRVASRITYAWVSIVQYIRERCDRPCIPKLLQSFNSFPPHVFIRILEGLKQGQ